MNNQYDFLSFIYKKKKKKESEHNNETKKYTKPKRNIISSYSRTQIIVDNRFEFGY